MSHFWYVAVYLDLCLRFQAGSPEVLSNGDCSVCSEQPERCMYMLVCPVRAPEPLPGNGCTTYISCPRAWQHSRPSPHSAHLKVSPRSPLPWDSETLCSTWLPALAQPQNPQTVHFPSLPGPQSAYTLIASKKAMLELGECTCRRNYFRASVETSGRMWRSLLC